MQVDEFTKWLELVENHGLSLILFGVIVVFYFIPWIKSIKKKADGEDSSKLEKTIELERLITLLLAQIANEFACQWAVLWQFHNGSLSASKVPFMRMSVTHEFSANGCSPRSELYQGIPISVFIDAVSIIQKETSLYVNLESPFPAVVNSYKRDGVACGTFLRINDNNGIMMGILSISYSEQHKKLAGEQMQSLTLYSVRLSSLLEQLAADYRHPRRRLNDD